MRGRGCGAVPRVLARRPGLATAGRACTAGRASFRIRSRRRCSCARLAEPPGRAAPEMSPMPHHPTARVVPREACRPCHDLRPGHVPSGVPVTRFPVWTNVKVAVRIVTSMPKKDAKEPPLCVAGDAWTELLLPSAELAGLSVPGSAGVFPDGTAVTRAAGAAFRFPLTGKLCSSGKFRTCCQCLVTPVSGVPIDDLGPACGPGGQADGAAADAERIGHCRQCRLGRLAVHGPGAHGCWPSTRRRICRRSACRCSRRQWRGGTPARWTWRTCWTGC
jgi:hypothetical protein